MSEPAPTPEQQAAIDLVLQTFPQAKFHSRDIGCSGWVYFDREIKGGAAWPLWRGHGEAPHPVRAQLTMLWMERWLKE